MRFFELIDDVYVPDRWHISEVTTAAGDEPRLSAGLAFSGAALHAEIGREGKALDFSLTSFAVPVARTALAEAMQAIAGTDLQRIPIDIPGHGGFEVVNATRIVTCLDESRSEFMKWTKDDHRSDLAGQYRMVTRLRILSDRLSGTHIVRIEGWRIALVVSETMKSAMEHAGCSGATFTDIT